MRVGRWFGGGSDKVQVGTWLQLMVVPPRLYVGDCPSISEVKFEGSEKSLERSEKCIRDVCQR